MIEVKEQQLFLSLAAFVCANEPWPEDANVGEQLYAQMMGWA